MSDGNAVLLLLRMVVSLAAVLGLLVLAVRILQRRQGGGSLRRRRGTDPMVEVLARQNLSRTASLHVVRVGVDVLALGVTESGIRVLSRLDPASTAELEAGPIDPPPAVARDVEATLPGEPLPGVVLDEPLTRRERRAAQRTVTLTGALTASARQPDGLESVASRQGGAAGQIVRALLTTAGLRRG